MRDRWVAVYLLLVVIQIPLYFVLGKYPLSFDFATKDAETVLRRPIINEADRERARTSLDEAESLLKASGDRSSRDARIEMDRGILAWKEGDSEQAIERLEKARQMFMEKHGADSFHAAALDLRVGELLYLKRRYGEAISRFRRSSEPVREYLGPRDQFSVRMVFREVSALVALGRNGEAAELAHENLALLLKVAGEQDDAFLQMTGGSLNILSLQGLIRKPPGGSKSWKSALTEAKKEARDLEDHQI